MVICRQALKDIVDQILCITIMVKATLKQESLNFVSRGDRMHHSVTKDRIYKAKSIKTSP